MTAAKAALDSAALHAFLHQGDGADRRARGRAEITRGNLVTGGNQGGTLLTTIVSLDPIYVYFEGDENAYLRYTAMARQGERSSSRDVTQPGARRPGGRARGFRTKGTWISSTTNSTSPPARFARARCSTTRRDASRPDCLRACNCSAAPSTTRCSSRSAPIGTDQSQNFVLVVGRDNKLEYRPVELGRNMEGLRS